MNFLELLNELINETCDVTQDCAGHPDKERWQRQYALRAEVEGRIERLRDGDDPGGWAMSILDGRS